MLLLDISSLLPTSSCQLHKIKRILGITDDMIEIHDVEITQYRIWADLRITKTKHIFYTTFYELYYKTLPFYVVMLAIKYEYINVIQWLCSKYTFDMQQLIRAAACTDKINSLKYLCTLCDSVKYMPDWKNREAVHYILERYPNLCKDRYFYYDFIKNDYADENTVFVVNKHILDYAATKSLALVKQVEKFNPPKQMLLMTSLYEKDAFEAVKYLVDNYEVECPDINNSAARNMGEMIKYVVDHTEYKVTSRALSDAVRYCESESLIQLYKYYPEIFTPINLQFIKERGQYDRKKEIIDYICIRCQHNWPTMKDAVIGKQFQMIQWYNLYHPIESYFELMQIAASYNNCGILRYLHKHRTPDCTIENYKQCNILRKALNNGRIKV